MDKQEYSAEYICTHLGEENAADVNFGAVVPPVYATSLHVFDDIEGLLGFNAADAKGKYIYGRVDNPTVNILEQKLAALEKADGALCFASGMAAITAAILHCMKPNCHIITIKNVYGPARTFLESYSTRYGVETTFISGMDAAEFEREIRPNTTMFYLESPSSAVLEMQDLKAIAAIAKKHGIMTAVDNTWATPIHQNPLEMGIDMVVHTMSKYIGGHSDIIGGVLCANNEIISSIKSNERELIGGIIGPFEAWLAIRGLRTMPTRLSRSGKNARAVAEILEKHPRVRRVNLPGSATYAQSDLAKQQMTGNCGLLSFEIDGTPEEAIALANNLKLFRKGVSWGGFESLVCMPCYKLSDEEAKNRNTSRNLIRLYCGLEDKDDLLLDVETALAGLK